MFSLLKMLLCATEPLLYSSYEAANAEVVCGEVIVVTEAVFLLKKYPNVFPVSHVRMSVPVKTEDNYGGNDLRRQVFYLVMICYK